MTFHCPDCSLVGKATGRAGHRPGGGWPFPVGTLGKFFLSVSICGRHPSHHVPLDAQSDTQGICKVDRS